MTLNWLRKQRIIIGDLVIAFVVAWLSFIVRVGTESISEFVSQAWLMSMIALFIKPLVLNRTGIYRIFWKYAESRDYLRVLASSILATFSLSLLLILLPIEQFPRSVIAIDLFLSSIAFMIYRRMAYTYYKSETYGRITSR
jgi:FlaA1/EpsC-like NDP-sugar epimerase